MAHRLITFDEDMTGITQSWTDIWALIQKYHLKSEDIERRNRIASLHSILMGIKNSKMDVTCDGDTISKENPPIVEWMKLEDRNQVWEFVLNHLRGSRNSNRDARLTAIVQNAHCVKCNFALASHYVYVADFLIKTCICTGITYRPLFILCSTVIVIAELVCWLEVRVSAKSRRTLTNSAVPNVHFT